MFFRKNESSGKYFLLGGKRPRRLRLGRSGEAAGAHKQAASAANPTFAGLMALMR
jgi:hypothetical protein